MTVMAGCPCEGVCVAALPGSGTLLRKSGDGQAFPFRGHGFPTAAVTGMPSAVNRRFSPWPHGPA